MARAIKGLVTGPVRVIVFTSVMPSSGSAKFEEFGLDARSFAGVKIAMCGRVYRGLGGGRTASGPDLVPSGGIILRRPARRLRALRRRLDPIDRILLPEPTYPTETLARRLRERGWESTT